MDGSSRSIGRNVEQGPFPVRIGEKSGLEFDIIKETLEIFKCITSSLDFSLSLKIEFKGTFWGEEEIVEIVDKVGEDDTIRDEIRWCVLLECIEELNIHTKLLQEINNGNQHFYK